MLNAVAPNSSLLLISAPSVMYCFIPAILSSRAAVKIASCNASGDSVAVGDGKGVAVGDGVAGVPHALSRNNTDKNTEIINDRFIFISSDGSIWSIIHHSACMVAVQ